MRSRAALLLPLLLVLAPAPAAPRGRTFGEARAAMLRGLRSADPAERSQAVYELDGFDDREAARTLVRSVLARDDRAQVIRAGLQLLGAMRSEDAREALVEEAARGETLKRARALEALGKWRTAEVEAPLLEAAYAPEPLVRISALLALEGVPGQRADVALGDGLAVEPWPVRSAAISVLRSRQSPAAVSELIDRFAGGKEAGRLLDDVRGALVRITGQDFGFSHSGWSGWYWREKGREPPEEVLGDVPAPDARAELAGVRTRARRIAYMLGLNQSMNDEVKVPGGARAPRDVEEAGGEELAAWAAAKTKLDFARLWIAWSIDHLAPDAFFEIVTYGSSPNAVFSELVPATPANREKAKRRVLSLSASGNSNLYAGLHRVFTITSKAPLDPEAFETGPEVVFHLSDGTSDYGEIPDGFRAFEEAERWDRYRQIRFHAFGVGTYDSRVVADLSSLGPGGEFGSLP